MHRRTCQSPFLIFTIAILVLVNGSVFADKPSEYVTWTGIGPDKWASAWLIHRHLDPGAKIRVVETGTTPTTGVSFDIPGIEPYFRDSQRTTFESLLSGFKVQNSLLIDIGQIVHDIEVNFWGGKQSEASPFVEHAFRGLQLTYGRESVPQSCYFQLFDALLHFLEQNPETHRKSALEQALAHNRQCGSVKNSTTDLDKKYVAEWHPRELLRFIGAGDKVVFIDTREIDEFEEGHIPGSINIRLRDIGRALPPEVQGADVVVPYCVKDFRAFEVAKRLKELGVTNVGLMNPWGISGWNAIGLPVAGTRGLQEAEAMQKLEMCINNPTTCMKDV